MQTICCVCHRVKNEHGQYTHDEIDLSQRASHGYCRECLQAELERQGEHDVWRKFKRGVGVDGE